MDNQNQDQPQTPPPNFDFIMNQPNFNGAANTTPDNHKKTSKKVIVLLVLVAITVLMLLAAILVPTLKEQNQNQAAQQSQHQSINDVATQHIKLVAEGKITESQQLFVNQTVLGTDQYKFLWGEFMPNNYNLNECKAVSKESNVTRVYCPRKNDPYQGSEFNYKIVDNKIDKIETIIDEEHK